LYLGVRDVKQAAQIHADIISRHPHSIHLVELDLGSLSSVRRAAASLLSSSGGRLNVLINNAGILGPPALYTEDGLESHLAVHYWGPFLLFQLLKDALVSTASPNFPSRVVNVTSKAHQGQRLDFADLNRQRNRKTSVLDAYDPSMLAKLYLALEINRRFEAPNLYGYALDPGVVHQGSAITRYVDDMIGHLWQDPVLQAVMMNPAQGAATSVWAAVSREALDERVRGKYLEGCALAKSRTDGVYGGVDEAAAYDEGASRQLWEASWAHVRLGEHE
jgi:NAD(P)-dependent dehydrogenase (short-subunit alcohol dehydrogenase family)